MQTVTVFSKQTNTPETFISTASLGLQEAKAYLHEINRDYPRLVDLCFRDKCNFGQVKKIINSTKVQVLKSTDYLLYISWLPPVDIGPSILMYDLKQFTWLTKIWILFRFMEIIGRIYAVINIFRESIGPTYGAINTDKGALVSN